jgi:DNA-binding response OmpR family regulator
MISSIRQAVPEALLSAEHVPPRVPYLLLAEDEPGLAEVLQLHLALAGFEVDVVGDGLATLYALQRRPPDMLLLDLDLPQVTGFRVLQLLRRDDAMGSIPVLVLTALSFQEAQEVARAGADDFLTKPVTPHAVVDRVCQLIARTAPATTAHPPPEGDP